MEEHFNNPEEAGLTNENPQLNKDQMERLMLHQNFGFALIGGLLTAFLCAVLWAFITVTTNYQIGYMAIAIGFMVGYSVRFFGLGIDKKFGILGASLALLGCLLGNLLSQVGFIANAESCSYMEALSLLDFKLAYQLLIDSFQPIDVLFYGFAIYEGYRFSFRKITPEVLAKTDEVNRKFRISLVVAAMIILTVIYAGVRKGFSSMKTYTYDTGEKMSEGMIENGKYQGAWTFFHKNGKMLSKGSFYNDLRDGDWEWYSEEGVLTETGSYQKGSEHGTWINYYANQAIKDSMAYVNGRVNGKYVAYYEDGKSIYQIGEYKNGLREGLWQTFYESGQVSSEGSYKKDEYVGKWVIYWENGEIYQDILYDGQKAKLQTLTAEDGTLLVENGNGIYKSYSDDNKTLLQEGEYRNGEKTGVWKSYYVNGKEREEGHYKEGVYRITNAWDQQGTQTVKEGSGKYVSYHEDGESVYETGEVKDGLLDGLWLTYFSDGTTKSIESRFKEGKREGPMKDYYESGNLYMEGEFTNGERNGKWIWYNEDGSVSSSVTYKNDLKEGVQIINDKYGVFCRKETYSNGELTDVKLTK